MATFARDTYTATASQTDFTISFSYLQNSHVVVLKDGVTQTLGSASDYTLPNSTTVRFNSALAGGEVVVVKRSTSQSSRIVDYTAGTLTEANLDNDSIQAFYMAQEAIDEASIALGLNAAGDHWDAESKKIQNLATPTATTDAVTKAYADALSVAAANVPTVTDVTDDGKVLAANAGSYGWENTLTSNVDDATEGPSLTLYRNSESPADNDVLGALIFDGEDSGGTQTTFAKIRSLLLDTTDATEDGQFEIHTMQAGTLTRALYAALGVVVGTATGGDQGAGTLNATGLYDDGTLVSLTGLQTIYVPASAIIPTVSNGCSPLTSVETTAGRPDMNVRDFDASADEHGQFSVAFPKSWDEGTITYRVFWTSAATDTDGVTFALQGVASADGDTIDVAYGTAITVDDANQSTAEDLYVSPTSAAVTIAGTPSTDELVFFRLFRDVSDANDTAAEDARVIGVQLFFSTDAGNDA
jgi:hypothetical protein